MQKFPDGAKVRPTPATTTLGSEYREAAGKVGTVTAYTDGVTYAYEVSIPGVETRSPLLYAEGELEPVMAW